MSRCRCCDAILNDRELKARNPTTGFPEDFCYQCRAAVFGISPNFADELEHLDFLGLNPIYLLDKD